MHVVMVGNPIDGYETYGPFWTKFDAAAWASEIKPGKMWVVVPLIQPNAQPFASFVLRRKVMGEEALVTVWYSGDAEYAVRTHATETWGQPRLMTRV